MKSIQDTMKITNAMYMISSSKMKRAQKILKDTHFLQNSYAISGVIVMHFWFSKKNKRFKETHFIFAFTISILYSI